jgi:exosome complex component RRP42
MSNTGIPKVEVTNGSTGENEADFEISDNPDEFSRLDTSGVPVIVTLTKVSTLEFDLLVFI